MEPNHTAARKLCPLYQSIFSYESYERKKDWVSIHRSILSASRYGNIFISRLLYSKTAKALLLIVCPQTLNHVFFFAKISSCTKNPLDSTSHPVSSITAGLPFLCHPLHSNQFLKCSQTLPTVKRGDGKVVI